MAGTAGLIAAVHPSLSSASRIAWPETLLALLVLVVALAVAFAVQHVDAAVSQRAWARAGLAATLAVAVHARMAVLAAAVVGTALLCRIGRRAWVSLGAGLLAGGAATAVTLTLTDAWPTERLSEAAQLDRGTEPIATVSGQLLALGGGTVGLGLIGLVTGLGAATWLAFGWRDRGLNEGLNPQPLPAGGFAAPDHGDRGLYEGPSLQRPGGFVRAQAARARSGRRTEPGKCSPRGAGPVPRSAGPDPLTAALVCLALGAFGAVLLGGWTLTGSTRADTLLYGRYVDPWAVPLVAVTLDWLATRQRTRPSASSLLAVSAVVATVSCALVVSVAGSYDDSARRIMTLSFTPAWTWFDERLGAVAAAALVATLLGVLLAAVALRGTCSHWRRRRAERARVRWLALAVGVRNRNRPQRRRIGCLGPAPRRRTSTLGVPFSAP